MAKEIVDELNKEVLIAPLWNWNRQLEGYTQEDKRSNRTFMELKC